MKYYSSHEFFEEGKKEGLEEGRVEGREEGIEQGEKRIQNSIIKKMLSMGQPLEFISECTDKPVEYIREIATKEPMFVREEGAYNVDEGGTENECREGEDEIMKYYSSHEFFEEGKKEGLEEGRVEGREEGIEQGEKRIQNSIIKKMLSMGQPLEFISECTDKPVEYIREIATKEPMLVREENTYDRNIKKKNVE